MHLYAYRILRVELNAETTVYEPLNRDWIRQFRGGRGLAETEQNANASSGWDGNSMPASSKLVPLEA